MSAETVTRLLLAYQFPGNAYCVLQMVRMIIKYSAAPADTAALFPGHAFCVPQMVRMIIKYSATTADTAAGGSGLSPDAGAVASVSQPQLAAAAGGDE